MRRCGLGIVAVILVCSWSTLPAVTVGGVEVPDTVRLDGVAQPLVLNGAGVRYKLFFAVYVGALYLPQPRHSTDGLLSDPPANRVTMHFVYDRVSRGKLEATWRDGFASNLDAARLEALNARLERFVAAFDEMHAGDVVWLDYVPGRGTRVSVNGQRRVTIEGADFNAALLSVWLGRDPASEALKNDLLGVDKP